ncbi:HD-GYP domain-containing protein [Chrysiogenes arsenatis]|uniref:HD-GYP domain-containing protein n=1 Tax=Chrysiogenes arsenatis TaxID=309797 RepID=UPI0004833699|nr:HD domain-containing phosphohydrolase [Chrysiogenes arsenatis]
MSDRRVYLISVDDLLPGQITAEPIYTPDGLLVVASQARLTDALIMQFEQLKIPHVKVHMPVVDDEESAGIPFALPDSTTVELREDTPLQIEFKNGKEAYLVLASMLNVARTQVIAGKYPSLPEKTIRLKVEQMIGTYRRNYRALMILSRTNMRQHESVQHALNRAIVSLAISIQITNDQEEIIDTVIAALVADIGMYSIPDSLTKNPGKLSAEDKKIIESHPLVSAKLLRTKGFSNRVLTNVLDHHERFDGTGYPRGMQGFEISVGGAVIGLADTYCAMTSKRSYKGSFSPTKALSELNSKRNVAFQGDLVEVLIRNVGIFPIGTLVELSNGEVGIVNRPNPDDPLLPRVTLVMGSEGKRKNYLTQINLADLEDVQIVKALDPDKFGMDVSSFLFMP